MDDGHHQRTRINSVEDNNISPLPASSPATIPLLSPNTINPNVRGPTSLNGTQALKTTYNFAAANGLSNGFTYNGSRLAAHHPLPQNSQLLTPVTTGPFFTPPYPLTTCPPVPATPPTHPTNVVVPFYSSHTGQGDYNSSAIGSSVNLWNHWWVICNCQWWGVAFF